MSTVAATGHPDPAAAGLAAHEAALREPAPFSAR